MGPGSGVRGTCTVTVCVRDDDARTFEFLVVSDTTGIAVRVVAAVCRGRRVKCYRLARGEAGEAPGDKARESDEEARRRETEFLVAKGYTPGSVSVSLDEDGDM
jgi:hypothetical protein